MLGGETEHILCNQSTNDTKGQMTQLQVLCSIHWSVGGDSIIMTLYERRRKKQQKKYEWTSFM